MTISRRAWAPMSKHEVVLPRVDRPLAPRRTSSNATRALWQGNQYDEIQPLRYPNEEVLGAPSTGGPLSASSRSSPMPCTVPATATEPATTPPAHRPLSFTRGRAVPTAVERDNPRGSVVAKVERRRLSGWPTWPPAAQQVMLLEPSNGLGH